MLSPPKGHPTCPSYTCCAPFMFKFALQTMKKESFGKKQFPGPAALGLILSLQLPWLLHAHTHLPPPASPPPQLASTFYMSQACLTEHYRLCHKLPPMKMPWPGGGARTSWEKRQGSIYFTFINKSSRIYFAQEFLSS